jgi:hypothetical protein
MVQSPYSEAHSHLFVLSTEPEGTSLPSDRADEFSLVSQLQVKLVLIVSPTYT